MTDQTIATPEEMLSALERWAAAAGLTVDQHPERDRKGWTFDASKAAGSGTVQIRAHGVGVYKVSPEIAIAWALTVEAGLEAVDVGVCPACVKRGGPSEWAQRMHFGEPNYPPDGEGWQRGTHVWSRINGNGYLTWARPCPECSGTGREKRDPARLVLDAAPTPVAPADVWLRAAMAEAAEPPRSGRTTRTLDAAARHVAEFGGTVVVGAATGDAQRLQRLALDRDPRILVFSMPTLLQGARGHRHGHVRVFIDHYAVERMPPMEAEHVAAFVVRMNDIKPGRDPGDPKAIEALTPLADHLQPHAFDRSEHDPARESAGHALAHLVALWLGGDLRETRASVEALARAWERLTVPCERCEASGRTRHSTKTWHYNSTPELVRDQTRWLRNQGWLVTELQAPQDVPFDDASYTVHHCERACPDCNGHGRVRPKSAEKADRGPLDAARDRARLITRLLAAVDSGDPVIEVDPRAVTGQQRVEAARHRPEQVEPLASILDEDTDPTQAIAGQVERFVFDILTVEHDGRRRAFAAREGTPDDLRFRIVQALLSLNDPATLARVVDQLR